MFIGSGGGKVLKPNIFAGASVNSTSFQTIYEGDGSGLIKTIKLTGGASSGGSASNNYYLKITADGEVIFNKSITRSPFGSESIITTQESLNLVSVIGNTFLPLDLSYGGHIKIEAYGELSVPPSTHTAFNIDTEIYLEELVDAV